ncbi:MAG: hypothetical protein KDC94_01710 [Aequorivita sp.]|nr:hypothetical protein [Aequorivita sp.]HPE82243.1 hypothetical protein [Aequorivita sp.]
MDLIKAPFAWNITQGNPSVKAGVVDTGFELTHEYLENQIVGQINANGTSNNYILDTTEFQTTIDISSYPTGLYSVALVCDGQIQQSKTLAKQ